MPLSNQTLIIRVFKLDINSGLLLNRTVLKLLLLNILDLELILFYKIDHLIYVVLLLKKFNQTVLTSSNKVQKELTSNGTVF